jgi:hypothetical protein
MIGRSGCSPEMDVLWQRGAGERLPDAIAADIGNPAQAVQQAERLKHGGVDADADSGIAGFDLLQGRAGREGAFGDNRHGETTATTGVMDIRAELT